MSHQEIGQELKLFFFDELSPGSCFFLPHGTIIYRKLENYIKDYYRRNGYREVITPNIADKKLWQISGHWDKYQENMFLIRKDRHGEQKVDEEDEEDEERIFGLKGMNCPFHCLMFKHLVPSYRDLPMRFADFGVLHRNELSGALRGLTRLYKFSQDDAHIFCTMEQIESEIMEVLKFLDHVYQQFGFQYEICLSTRPEKYIGSIEKWNQAEEILAKVIDQFTGCKWKLNPADGAFYGPKLDITLQDSLGRKHQCGTIQLDFNLPLPERFNLKYRDQDDQYKEPVIIHRAILGSIERFMAILLEHTGGKLPFWLSPRQIFIVPFLQKEADKVIKYLEEVKNELSEYEVEIDYSENPFQNKIKYAFQMKYNYIFCVGRREADRRTLNWKKNDKENQEIKLDELKNLN